MAEYANFTEHVESMLIDAPSPDGDMCLSDAQGWCCVRPLDHDMPHQASSGYVGSHVYAEWEDA